MPLIDIGINLMHPSFDKDREEVIGNAKEAGVDALIITGTDIEASQEAASYIDRNPDAPCKLFYTAGIHPHEAKTWDNASRNALMGLGKNAVAIGECGLDYVRDYSPRPLQRHCFEKQLELAAELNLPLFLHERGAFADFAAMLKDSMAKVPGAVVHCFTGDEGELETYLDMGCHIGITGWICDERRGQQLRALASKIPSHRLLLETDAPFLIPRDLPQKSGQRNEPKYLPHIADAVAHHQNKDPREVAEESYINTLEFFNIMGKF